MTTTDTLPRPRSPFHEGEVAIQQRYGVVERMARFGSKAVRDFLPDQHRDFYAELPFVLLGTVDQAGRPWASILAAPPGFLSTPDRRRIRIDAKPVEGDPLSAALVRGAAVGGLGLQFETRRRNRFTAHVESVDATGFTLSLDHSSGNCPQYIVTRRATMFAKSDRDPGGKPSGEITVEHLDTLDAAATAAIRASDTFFVASFAPGNGTATGTGSADRDARFGADVSHRGGKPGFVRVAEDGTLTIPDFAGNLHFNTLGNLLLNPRAGLLFVDFTTGDLLLLTGETEIDFDGPEIAAFQGAERLWRFRASEVIRLRGALPLRFRDGEASPNSLLTGDWDAAAARLEAEARRNEWRRWRVVETRDESTTIRSLTLEPADGGGVPGHIAGQFLPLRLEVPGMGCQTRTYTLSSAPSDDRFRISVKREGAVSAALHDLVVGDEIEARAPRGVFTLDPTETRPAVLLSAGVGITPMVSMLRHVVWEGARSRRVRPVWFLHGARTAAERGFFEEVRGLAAASDAITDIWALSVPTKDARPGVDCNLVGRLDVDLLKRVLPFDDHDFYLCGPAGFVRDLYDGLRSLGVRDARIQAESFGPSALTRRPDEAAPGRPKPEGVAAVTFTTSGRTVGWTPESGTLLELAEAAGLSPAHGCRSGGCGACAVKLTAGEVAYPVEPTAPIGPGEALICRAVPKASDGGQKVALSIDV